MNEEIKTILIKAVFAGLYGAVAHIAAIQTLDWNTLKISLGSAAIRFVIAFSIYLKETLNPTDKVSVKIKKNKDISWKKYI
jgi:hypothetical protein